MTVVEWMEGEGGGDSMRRNGEVDGAVRLVRDMISLGYWGSDCLI